MTHALRVRHRRMVLGLAVLLPPAVAIGLAVRPARPITNLPVSIAPAVPRAPLDALWRGSLATGGLRIEARLGRDGDRVALELESTTRVGEPDLLVYWTPTSPGEVGLPPASVLLGVLSLAQPQRLSLPDAARARDGFLAIYSLPHGRVVAREALPTHGLAAAGDSR